MSGSGKQGSSWLDRIAQLLAHERRSPSNPRRKLLAERLEQRTVLTAAPIVADEAPGGPSLAEYLAQEHAMGPAAPAENAASASDEDNSAADAPADIANGPALADHFFQTFAGQGQGEGEGSSSGSGSGGGAGSGSAASSSSGSGEGSGGASGQGSGTGEGSGASSGSGSGTGGSSGSGSGTGGTESSGSGEGSGGGESSNSGGNQPPTIEGFWIEYQGDFIVLHGAVANDGGVNGLTVTFGDLVHATVTPDWAGEFHLTVPKPVDQGNICVTATDAAGLTSEPAWSEYAG